MAGVNELLNEIELLSREMGCKKMFLAMQFGRKYQFVLYIYLVISSEFNVIVTLLCIGISITLLSNEFF